MTQAAGISRQKAFGALDSSVLGDVSFDTTDIIRAGGSTPIATSHARQGTEEMDFDPVRMDDGGAVVCRATDRGGKGGGAQVHWVIEGALELVDWYIWAACTPLVIGLAKRFPLTGPRLARHIALHTIVSLMMAPLASVTQYFLSLGLLRFVFHITGPDVHRFLSSFGLGVLFMSFTGVLTYWLVVGLYQSMHFYQVAMERQTIAAQLETQLSHAELENLKSQLQPHFLFNSLHAIGVLMQEDVDAAGRLLVSLGDLLRMALERRENEITLQSELEFVGKYLEIEQTRFHVA
jgi:two-component system, LytTR family, sensor kinase